MFRERSEASIGEISPLNLTRKAAIREIIELFPHSRAELPLGKGGLVYDRSNNRFDVIIDPDQERVSGEITRFRLESAYRYVRNWILRHNQGRRLKKCLDIGFYNGFALPIIHEYAESIHAIDADPKRLPQARENPVVKSLEDQGIITLEERLAQHIEGLKEKGPFDVINLVEILGVALQGKKTDVGDILRKSYDLLDDGGYLVVNVLGKTTDRLLKRIARAKHDEKAEKIPVYRNDVINILSELFGEENIKMKGQFFYPRDEKGHLSFPRSLRQKRTHGSYGESEYTLDPDAFWPRDIGYADQENAGYWLLIAQKPSKSGTIFERSN